MLFPDASTFGKLFKRFNMGHCHELSAAEAEAQKRVWLKKWFPWITLDMDSTVIGVTGSQEGAEKGYNPKKRGQKSYHPLLCEIAEAREYLHNWFRAVEFLKECYERIPQRAAQLFVRADSGFFDGDLLDFLESRQGEYLTKVKMRNLVELPFCKAETCENPLFNDPVIAGNEPSDLVSISLKKRHDSAPLN